jgi:hypothetical protein
MLYLLTPTRYRSRCFKLLTQYLRNQDFQGEFKWIAVCDGGADKYEVPDFCQFVRRRVDPDEPLPSICMNYLEGLRHCVLTRDARILCVEDDEIYHRHYLTTFNKWLDEFDMVGEGNAHYYQWVYSTYCEVDNTVNASLCQTGFKGQAIDYFDNICRTRKLDDPYIDIACWSTFNGSKKVFPFSGTCISMKSLWTDNPDHKGYGMGHAKNIGEYDYAQTVLKKWAGEYAENYKPEPIKEKPPQPD